MTLSAAVKIFVALGCFDPSLNISDIILYSQGTLRYSYQPCDSVSNNIERLKCAIKEEEKREAAEKKENEKLKTCKEAYERMEKEK